MYICLFVSFYVNMFMFLCCVPDTDHARRGPEEATGQTPTDKGGIPPEDPP